MALNVLLIIGSFSSGSGVHVFNKVQIGYLDTWLRLINTFFLKPELEPELECIYEKPKLTGTGT